MTSPTPMLDRPLRKIIDPVADAPAPYLLSIGLTADRITVIGFILGMVAMVAIANQAYGIGLVFILANRVCDGVDGAVARRSKASDVGGYLDIVADFLFYGGVAFAFALARQANQMPAAFLLFSFIGTGTTFLTFAIFAEKHRLHPARREHKAFVYLGGLTEGTETILLFLFICLWPDYFPQAAYLFGLLCWVTVIGRIWSALAALTGPKGGEFRSEQ